MQKLVQGTLYTRRTYPAISDTMEIVPGIHQVEGVNGNCYVIVRDGIFIVDTGLPGAEKKILSYIRDTLGKNPADIKTIILTHYHIDHTGNVNALKSAGAGKVAMHRLMRRLLPERNDLHSREGGGAWSSGSSVYL